MYLGSDDHSLAGRPPSRVPPQITHTTVSLHYLHEYISNTHYPLCATPPLNQLFENLQTIEDEQVNIKLYSCSLQVFQKKYNNQNEDTCYIFYLYSGRMFLGRKQGQSGVEQQTKQRESARRKNSVYISSQSNKSEIKSQENQEKIEQKDKKDSSGAAKDKYAAEIKDNSFFSLINLKKPNQPQKYSLANFEAGQAVPGKCLYGVLKISKKFGNSWYMQESKKYLFLSKIFRKSKIQLSQGKLKVISRFFKQQRYRRGTTLIRENQQNQKLLIMSDGQCEYEKNYESPIFKLQKVHNLRLANAGAESIFGAEFLLYRFSGFSKIVTVTTQALIDRYYVNQEDEEQLAKQEEGEVEPVKKVSPKKNVKHKKKQESPEKVEQKSKDNKDNKDKESKCKEVILPLHKSSANNFTVTITSAYADFYYISLERFKEISVKYAQELPFNLRETIQNNYVTLLRNLKEKIDLQIVRIRRNIDKTSEDRVTFEARVKSGQYGAGKDVLIGMSNKRSSIEEVQSQSTEEKLKIGRSELIKINLKSTVTDMSRNKRLQKKISLALQDKKPVINFKKKIQVLLKEKLTDALGFETNSPPRKQLLQSRYSSNRQSPVLKLFNSPNPPHRNSPELPTNTNKQQILLDLQEIFMNKDENYRSQSIGRQYDILKKKESLLKKRYGSTQNNLIINQQSYDIRKNKQFRMDLLKKGLTIIDVQKRQGIEPGTHESVKSLDTKEYSNRIKKQYTEKINKANKIKEQFMTIRSQCETCHCYDDLDGIYNKTGGFKKDLKTQTMRTGSVWRLSESQKEEKKDQPLEKLHSRTKLISEKTVSKYHHNEHLRNKRKGLISGFNRRRLSAPLLGNMN